MFTIGDLTVDLHDPRVYVPLTAVWLALFLWALTYALPARDPRSDVEIVDETEPDEETDEEFEEQRPETDRVARSPSTDLVPVEHVGADDTWEPKEELIAEVIDENDPRTWDDERYLDVLHTVLDTPTMTWTVVDQETADWEHEFRALDDRLERARRTCGAALVAQDWGIDMARLLRDLDERDWTLHQVALEVALTLTTDEHALVPVG